MRSKFSKSKRILKPLLVPAVFFIGMVCFHDDKIPDELSDADQQYVSQVNSTLEQSMIRVISEMKRFVAEPENESAICVSLAASIDSQYNLGGEFLNDGRFFAVTEENLRYAKRLWELNEELAVASDAMVKKVASRVESGEHDEEGYQLLTRALSPNLVVGRNAPCDKSNCIWCFYRRTFRLD